MQAQLKFFRSRCATRRARHIRTLLYWCCAAAIGFLISPILRAQTTSTLEGTIKDKQGLAIAGVQVQVISAALAIDRTVATESDGSYRFAGLPPGIYEIHAAKTGFESEISKNLEVTLNRVVVYDITLQVGAVTQTIEVDSATPLLETATSST